jgi:hypothetical protein
MLKCDYILSQEDRIVNLGFFEPIKKEARSKDLASFLYFVKSFSDVNVKLTVP